MNSDISVNKKDGVWRIEVYDCSGRVTIHLNDEQMYDLSREYYVSEIDPLAEMDEQGVAHA